MATPKSRKSTTTSSQVRRRPFAPAIIEQAKAIAERYQIILWFEDGYWYGRGVELPGAMNDGKTPGECIRKTREALVAVVATLIELSDMPVAP